MSAPCPQATARGSPELPHGHQGGTHRIAPARPRDVPDMADFLSRNENKRTELLALPDARTGRGKRLREFRAALLTQCGPNPTTVQVIVVDRATAIQAQLASLEARSINSGQAMSGKNLVLFTALSINLTKCLRLLISPELSADQMTGAIARVPAVHTDPVTAKVAAEAVYRRIMGGITEDDEDDDPAAPASTPDGTPNSAPSAPQAPSPAATPAPSTADAALPPLGGCAGPVTGTASPTPVPQQSGGQARAVGLQPGGQPRTPETDLP